MDYSSKPRVIGPLMRNIEKGTFKLEHYLQRKEDQWKPAQKSDLIDSIFRKYPINPIYVVKEDNTLSVIDGLQRITAIRDFINDKFKLNNYEPIEINGVSYEISGKKFSKLDEEVKNVFTDSQLDLYILENWTDEDVIKIFYRQNNGKPLNNRQKRIVYESREFGEAVHNLAEHPFMKKVLTKAQAKSGADRDSIIQALMLICTNQDNDFTSFRTKDIDAFVRDYSNIALEKASTLKDAMDKLDEAFSDIKIAITSVPQLLYAAYRVQKDKKSFTKLADAIANFLDTYDTNEEYKAFLQSGTSSQVNVRGRFDYWRNLIKTI